MDEARKIDSAVDEACDEVFSWYEGKRNARGNINTNVMTVGIAVAELLKDNFPLTDEVVKSRNESQVRGLSRNLIVRVLRENGEMQDFTSEGGRTSRGSLPLALELARILNESLSELCLEDAKRRYLAKRLQIFFVRKIQQDYFAKQRIQVELDASKPISAVVDSVLKAAKQRPDQPVGIVAQHLVGAKLELRFPELTIGRDKANAADQQTNRQGDYQIGTMAFHVTMAPSSKLISRVRENATAGFRSCVLVPQEKVQFAIDLFASEGLDGKVATQSIESFVGTNIEEMAEFGVKSLRYGLACLIRRYNERIASCETDKSLMIVEPEWLEVEVGPWDESSVEWGVVSL